MFAGGARVYVRGLGRLVFIHGVGQDGSAWDSQLAHFPDSMAVDLPGHGLSDGPPLNSVLHAAMWLNALIESHDLAPVRLVGHGLGGLIALEYMARFGSQVSLAVLVGTALRMRWPISPYGLAPQDMEAQVRQLFGPAPPGALVGRELAVLGSIERRVRQQDILALDNYRPHRKLAGISVPTLLVLGASDPLTSSRSTKALQRRLGHVTTVVMKRCGHMMMKEDPNAFNGLLQQFLDHPFEYA